MENAAKWEPAVPNNESAPSEESAYWKMGCFRWERPAQIIGIVLQVVVLNRKAALMISRSALPLLLKMMLCMWPLECLPCSLELCSVVCCFVSDWEENEKELKSLILWNIRWALRKRNVNYPHQVSWKSQLRMRREEEEGTLFWQVGLF